MPQTSIMLRNIASTLAALMVLATANGCSAPTEPDSEAATSVGTPVVMLTAASARALQNCAGVAAGVTVMSQQQAQRLGARQMLTPADGAQPPAVTDGPAQDVPQAAVISRGSQASAGYRFEFVAAKQHGDQLKLAVTWHEPAPGSMQATVITNPCLVVDLPSGS